MMKTDDHPPTPAELLKKALAENDSRILDRRTTRNGKGQNRYSQVLATPEIHETIFKLLDKRASRSSIFNFLQDHNFFDENADRPSFVRALTRLEKRHGRIHAKASSPTKPSKSSTVISAPLALPSRRSEIPVDVEYERDGKRFTVLKGVEREVPEGSHVLRGAVVPKLVIESVRKPLKDHYGCVEPSQLPSYIKKSRDVSMRNGTVIEDAEKHEQMAKEFEKLWESGMEKEDFEKCRFPIDDNAPIGAWFVRDGKYYAVNFAGEEVCIPPGYNFIRDKCRPIPPDEKLKNDDDEFVNFSDYPKYIQNVIRVTGKEALDPEARARNIRLINEWKAAGRPKDWVSEEEKVKNSEGGRG